MVYGGHRVTAAAAAAAAASVLIPRNTMLLPADVVMAEGEKNFGHGV